jgi:hypothetical protein
MEIQIVPIEKAAAENLRIFDAVEALAEFQLVFEDFEVAFRERVVVCGKAWSPTGWRPDRQP